jgi:hypothetical protein
MHYHLMTMPKPQSGPNFRLGRLGRLL